jgi:hypothetical protein
MLGYLVFVLVFLVRPKLMNKLWPLLLFYATVVTLHNTCIILSQQNITPYATFISMTSLHNHHGTLTDFLFCGCCSTRGLSWLSLPLHNH